MTQIEISQALRIVDKILEPNRLNTVEELVLRECWLGKTYQDIAASSGYDSDYIRVVGSRLWQSLSDAVAEKVTKHNFKSVLRQQATRGQFSLSTLELPDSKVPLNSQFYINRPPCEDLAYEEITNPGALIRIKSPLHMGKTSLAFRIVEYSRQQNYHTVGIDCQLAEASVFSDINKFLRWLMANITLQLKMTSAIDEYWDDDLGAKVSCTTYFQGHILQQLTQPLVLVLDEVNHLFEYPQIAQEFLPLLRFWYEEANNLADWQRLRLVVVHSTDIYLPLDINQSPFNLGLPINLPEFTFEQMKDLAIRHPLREQVADLDQSILSLMEMIGGHPHLARLAFYALSTRNITFEQLLAEAPYGSGIYRSHLQGLLATLEKYHELSQTYQQVIAAAEPVEISANNAYKLESIGLVKWVNNAVVPACQLYRLYFRHCIEV